MSSSLPTVEILLSSYNGSKYIRQQLDSIIAQLYGGVSVLIRDDGSTDSTPHIIREYALKHSCVNVLEIGDNLGVTKSFAKLLENSVAKYIVFSDQDDIWLPKKLESIISALVENDRGAKRPCLVVSEMVCVNQRGDSLGVTFSKRHGVRLSDNGFNRILMQNVITGAACGMNRELYNIAAKGISCAYIHDWWIALCASSQGRIITIKEPLVAYRLHGANEIGANEVSFKRLYSILKSVGLKSRVDKALYISNQQAVTYKKFHFKSLSDLDRDLLNGFINLKSKSFLEKRIWLLGNKTYFSSLKRNIALFYFL